MTCDVRLLTTCSSACRMPSSCSPIRHNLKQPWRRRARHQPRSCCSAARRRARLGKCPGVSASSGSSTLQAPPGGVSAESTSGVRFPTGLSLAPNMFTDSELSLGSSNRALLARLPFSPLSARLVRCTSLTLAVSLYLCIRSCASQAARRASCPIPGALREPEASAARLAVQRRLHAWRVRAAGVVAPAPPEPPPVAALLLAWAGHAVLRPPDHVASFCVQRGQFYPCGHGTNNPCRPTGVLPRPPPPRCGTRLKAHEATLRAAQRGSTSVSQPLFGCESLR